LFLFTNIFNTLKTTRLTSASAQLLQVGLGCSLVVQRLPGMREALGSMPAPKKKRQKKTLSSIITGIATFRNNQQGA
jgi:hypothetical protein